MPYLLEMYIYPHSTISTTNDWVQEQLKKLGTYVLYLYIFHIIIYLKVHLKLMERIIINITFLQ